jgi:hypothetical protein
MGAVRGVVRVQRLALTSGLARGHGPGGGLCHLPGRERAQFGGGRAGAPSRERRERVSNLARESVSDRPSRRPTSKMARVNQPHIPHAPAVPSLASVERASSPPTESAPPPSHDTTPPPPAYGEVRRLSRRPPSPGSDGRRTDSDAVTLPTTYAIPKLLVERPRTGVVRFR